MPPKGSKKGKKKPVEDTIESVIPSSKPKVTKKKRVAPVQLTLDELKPKKAKRRKKPLVVEAENENLTIPRISSLCKTTPLVEDADLPVSDSVPPRPIGFPLQAAPSDNSDDEWEGTLINDGTEVMLNPRFAAAQAAGLNVVTDTQKSRTSTPKQPKRSHHRQTPVSQRKSPRSSKKGTPSRTLHSKIADDTLDSELSDIDTISTVGQTPSKGKKKVFTDK